MTKISKAVASKSKVAAKTGKQLSKSKKSELQEQGPDGNVLSLRYLTAKQGLVLTSVLLHPTDAKAIESLGWSRATFYKYKAQIEPLIEDFAKKLQEQTMFSLGLAGRHAVSKYIELLDKGNDEFQRDTADIIMDRLGVVKKMPDETAMATPVVQNIIANKWDKYGEE